MITPGRYGGALGGPVSRSALLLVTLLPTLLFGATQAVAVPSPGLDGGKACAAQTELVHVGYTVSMGGPEPVVTAVELIGFGEACDGLPVIVVLRGNSRGDSSRPASDLLSTFDSRTEPCSRETRKDPLSISSGAISMSGCSTTTAGSFAAYASVHDTTQVAVLVAGRAFPTGPPAAEPPTTPDEVLGEEAEASGASSAGGESGGSDSGGLPATGTTVGLLLLLTTAGLLSAGSIMIMAGRRRAVTS